MLRQVLKRTIVVLDGHEEPDNVELIPSHVRRRVLVE
jgi:hypothetical protein